MATRNEELISGFAKSTIYSLPELFGFDAPKDVVKWRIDNPVGGFSSSALGTMIPYLGWYKATKYVRAFDTMVEGAWAARVASNPFLVRGAQEAIRFAPLELSRAGIAMSAGDSSMGEAINELVINEALAFGAGGLVGKLGSLGKRVTAKQLSDAADVNLTHPPQLQLRAFDNYVPTLPPESRNLYYERMQTLGHNVRAEEPTYQGRYMSWDLEGGKDRNVVEPLFKPTKSTRWVNGRKVKKLLFDRKYFNNDGDWQTILGAAGMDPKEFERYARYPRIIEFQDDQAAQAGVTRLRQGLDDLGNGWFAAKDKQEMWTVAKHIQPQANSLDPHRVVLAQTDDLDWFLKKQAQVSNNVMDFNKWTRQELDGLPNGGKLATEFEDYLKQMPFRVYDQVTAISPDGRIRALFDKVAAFSGKVANKGGLGVPVSSVVDNVAVRQVMDFLHRQALPLQHQFGTDKMMKMIVGTYRNFVERGRLYGDDLLQGKYASGGGSLIREMNAAAEGGNRTGGIWQRINKLSTTEMKQLKKLVYDEKPDISQIAPKIKSGEITQEVGEIATHLHENTAKQLNEEFMKQRRRYASTHGVAPVDRYVISKRWEGNLLQPYYEGSILKGVVSGNSEAEIAQKAKPMLEANPTWTPGQKFESGHAPREIRSKMILARQGRSNLAGYEHYASDMSKKDFLKLLEDNVYAMTNKLAVNASDNLFWDLFEKARRDNPHMFPAMMDRINDMKGETRPTEAWINNVSDKIMAPMLGKDSASKISQGMNTGLYHWTMGILNVATTVVNTMSHFVSTIPEQLYALNKTLPTRDATYHIAMGANGPVGTLGIWDASKASARAVGKLFKPIDAADLPLWNKAVEEGVLLPQHLTELTGQKAITLTNMKQAVKDRAVAELFKQTSGYLTTKSEQLSRTVSFMSGIEAAKLVGVKDPETIYQLAKTITHNSQFRYTQADRAGFMTTPIGGLIGLFKHWPISYMGNTVKYLSEGVNYGNWRPLMWQQASAWAVGGLSSTPLVLAAEGFNNLFSDDSLTENLYSMFDEEDANAVYFGLPAYLGVALTSASATPGANGIQDIVSMFTPVVMDRAKYMSMAVGQSFSNWQATREMHPASDPQVNMMLWRAFAPRTLYRLYQSVQDDTINSFSSGYPILKAKDTSLADKLYNAMGIPTVEISKKYEAAEQLYREKARRSALVSAHGEAYAQAMDSNDSRMQWEIIQSAISAQIDVGSVMKSAAERTKRHDSDVTGRTGAPPELVYKVMKSWGL